jgi:hypothetical protein
VHKYGRKKEFKWLGSGIWNSRGGVYRLGPSQRQHLQSVEKQEPEVRRSSLLPSEPDSGQGGKVKQRQTLSIDWYDEKDFPASQQESAGSGKQ